MGLRSQMIVCLIRFYNKPGPSTTDHPKGIIAQPVSVNLLFDKIPQLPHAVCLHRSTCRGAFIIWSSLLQIALISSSFSGHRDWLLSLYKQSFTHENLLSCLPSVLLDYSSIHTLLCFGKGSEVKYAALQLCLLTPAWC